MTGSASDGLVTSMAPLPADEVGDQDDEDQAGQGGAHDDGDQHVILVQLTLLGWGRRREGEEWRREKQRVEEQKRERKEREK